MDLALKFGCIIGLIACATRFCFVVLYWIKEGKALIFSSFCDRVSGLGFNVIGRKEGMDSGGAVGCI